MLLIFGLSTNAGAPRNTSRIIGPMVRWLVPGISDEAVGRVVLVVRKGAHVSEYAVLALLCWRARRRSREITAGPEPADFVQARISRGDARPWRWADATFALALTVAFAASDEWHQSFVPSRQGSWRDVLLDSGGAALGLLVLWRLGRWRQRW